MNLPNRVNERRQSEVRSMYLAAIDGELMTHEMADLIRRLVNCIQDD